MRNLVVAVALVLIACGSDGGSKASGGGGATSSGGAGATGATTSAGGGGSGSPGSEGKACYPNGTCNASLTCLSNLCVNAGAAAGGSAAGGATSGAGGSTKGDGGASGSGGVQRTGGATSAGGKSGDGGAGTGGATGNGGSSGSGGSSTFCYPVDPTHTDGTFTACASGLGCYPTPTGDTHCAGPTTASGTEGVDCFALSGQPDNTKCALGYFCGSGLTCQKYCRVSMPFCPNSELCEIFPGRALLAGPEEIGFCY